jgi:hypothetical protein
MGKKNIEFVENEEKMVSKQGSRLGEKRTKICKKKNKKRKKKFFCEKKNLPYS